MRRLLSVLVVCALGFVLGAALRDVTRPAASTASPAQPEAAIEALRADLAALERRTTEQLADLAAATPDDAGTVGMSLPEQLTAPAEAEAAVTAALRADLASLDQRLAARLDAIAATQAAATAAIEARLEALEDALGAATQAVDPLPNAPLPRP